MSISILCAAGFQLEIMIGIQIPLQLQSPPRPHHPPPLYWTRRGWHGSLGQADPALEGKRPDVDLDLISESVSVDVTIVHPSCPSNVQHGTRRLGCASFAEGEKVSKHARSCARRGTTFLPLGIETYGALGKAWKDFFERFCSFRPRPMLA